ncbi:hypothetical protein BCR33DRAFT_750659 [Rhizoclosmatium globosum]|uniref:Uncharacterized protein n=1 Tax=Rhizoclosmatium globosum TaxID=329046 RepID=A0A1Y2AC74_9FUNG|nr:hypothetical protein BCR33DRAFT_750659 [Rhizoclosmatium globosum]|eukprot:ORY20169.1 hypothetical protein BCR33DRAFT_750659 [Rhizoclosmatium globosum]
MPPKLSLKKQKGSKGKIPITKGSNPKAAEKAINTLRLKLAALERNTERKGKAMATKRSALKPVFETNRRIFVKGVGASNCGGHKFAIHCGWGSLLGRCDCKYAITKALPACSVSERTRKRSRNQRDRFRMRSLAIALVAAVFGSSTRVTFSHPTTCYNQDTAGEFSHQRAHPKAISHVCEIAFGSTSKRLDSSEDEGDGDGKQMVFDEEEEDNEEEEEDNEEEEEDNEDNQNNEDCDIGENSKEDEEQDEIVTDDVGGKSIGRSMTSSRMSGDRFWNHGMTDTEKKDLIRSFKADSLRFLLFVPSMTGQGDGQAQERIWLLLKRATASEVKQQISSLPTGIYELYKTKVQAQRADIAHAFWTAFKQNDPYKLDLKTLTPKKELAQNLIDDTNFLHHFETVEEEDVLHRFQNPQFMDAAACLMGLSQFRYCVTVEQVIKDGNFNTLAAMASLTNGEPAEEGLSEELGKGARSFYLKMKDRFQSSVSVQRGKIFNI